MPACLRKLPVRAWHTMLGSTALILFLAADLAAQTPPLRWETSVYGPENSPATLGCGSCTSDQRTMAVDAAGDVIVTGYTDTATFSDFLTVKFSGTTGAEIWRQRFDSAFSAFDQSWALALDGDGNAIVTGYFWSGFEYDIKVIMYAAADGAILWQTQFDGPASGIDFGIAIGVDSAGNVIVGGNVGDGITEDGDDMVTVKFAAADGAVPVEQDLRRRRRPPRSRLRTDGGRRRQRHRHGRGDRFRRCRHRTGRPSSTRQPMVPCSGRRATPARATVWISRTAIAVDTANNVIIAGNTHKAATSTPGLSSTRGNGAVLWEQTFAGRAAATTSSTRWRSTRRATPSPPASPSTGSQQRWNTVKYRGADGVQVWAKTFASSRQSERRLGGVALDTAGNAIVGGRVNNSADPANRDIAGGASTPVLTELLLWSYTYAGSATDSIASRLFATRPGEVSCRRIARSRGVARAGVIVKLAQHSISPPASRLQRRPSLGHRCSATRAGETTRSGN